jgi:hypothetical protein
MSEKKEVESLLSNIAEQATAASEIKTHSAVSAKEFGGWNGATDLTPYKRANSWPGSKYCLMGNSFNVELKGALEAGTKERMQAIQTLLKAGSGCVPVRDALRNEVFAASLSRFERDWLSRLPEETVVGKAYDQIGNPIQEAFSVWRKDFVPNRSSRAGLLTK